MEGITVIFKFEIIHLGDCKKRRFKGGHRESLGSEPRRRGWRRARRSLGSTAYKNRGVKDRRLTEAVPRMMEA